MSAIVSGTIIASDRQIDRELSWLDFNERVLTLASEQRVPLLERTKFCAIFASNLDEFYEVRVAGLQDLIAPARDPKAQRETLADARLAGRVVGEIGARVQELVVRQAEMLRRELLPELAANGIEIVGYQSLSAADRARFEDIYQRAVFPVLTPLAVDPGHPFPYLSNLSLNLGAVVVHPENGERRFARVKVPPLLPRFLVSEDGRRFLPLEDLMDAHLGTLFPGMRIEQTFQFRVTRDTDLDLEEEDAADLLTAVEDELRRRRFGRAVRLEVREGIPPDVLELLLEELDLHHRDVTRVDGMLDLGRLWALHRLDRPELKDEPWTPRVPARLRPDVGESPDIFLAIRDGDVLVHHPYDSFKDSVEAFVEQAAVDPKVVAIKLTLYRTSGDSPIAKALIQAAEGGKQVAVLVELKARFDEQANIGWARAMEQAGVHVVYGIVGLKTHTKVALVVRQEADGLRRYCHVATGNYHPSTARLYEDMGLFTTDEAIGNDVTRLFNHLTGFSQATAYERLVVAPAGVRPRITELIKNEHPNESRGAGRIFMKMNSLVDPQIIESLYDASNAGVEIDLVIRGICCLRPGVPGMSENIRVRSIVGRFLEHSRVFHFANGAAQGVPIWLIGSADLMPRNLDRRVEALVPILDSNLIAELRRLADVLLADNVGAWVLTPEAQWVRVRPAEHEEAVDAQSMFQRLASLRADA